MKIDSKKMIESVFFKDVLLKWYRDNKRDILWRHEKDPYTILIVEKLLQQTSYRHVLNVYEDFFKRYPSLESLHNSTATEIETEIKSLGFQRQRSKQIKAIAETIIKEHNGIVPSKKEILEGLCGIGPYIANAVLCFAYDQKVPIVDVNVRRVVERYFSWGGLNDKLLYKKIFEIMPNEDVKEFNWGLIDFASLICKKKPLCNKCKLKRHCKHNLLI